MKGLFPTSRFTSLSNYIRAQTIGHSGCISAETTGHSGYISAEILVHQATSVQRPLVHPAISVHTIGGRWNSMLTSMFPDCISLGPYLCLSLPPSLSRHYLNQT
uniref:Uncharacterized protein n=1 Tax=Arion vulgaris TaxID=1028688 RepID=A0A0B6ZFI4_9EUPU